VKTPDGEAQVLLVYARTPRTGAPVCYAQHRQGKAAYEWISMVLLSITRKPLSGLIHPVPVFSPSPS